MKKTLINKNQQNFFKFEQKKTHKINKLPTVMKNPLQKITAKIRQLNTNNLKFYLRIFLVVLSIILLELGFYFLLSIFVPFESLRVVTIIVVHFVVIFYVRHLMIFPGSSFFTKRYFEHTYGIHLTKGFIAVLEDLENLTQAFLDKKLRVEESFTRPQFDEIKSTIDLISQILNKMKSKNLQQNPKNIQFFQKITNLIECMKETNLSASHLKINCSLWSVLADWSCVLTLLHYSFDKTNEAQIMLDHIATLKSMLKQTLVSRKCNFIRKSNYLLGSLEYLRIMHEIRHGGKRIVLKTAEKIKIDSFFILSSKSLDGRIRNKRKSFEYMLSLFRTTTNNDTVETPQLTERTFDADLLQTEDSSLNQDFDPGPTVIFFSPNAGLYETEAVENQWVQFYIENGINIFLWNYRGYGKSESYPTLNNICKDSLAVYDYLKNKLKIARIAAHGQSLGCYPATFLASQRSVEYLAVDRGFSSIQLVVRYSFPQIFLWFYNFLNTNKSYYVNLYLDLKLPKLVIYDPQDAVINLGGSLVSGITQYLINNQIASAQPATNNIFKQTCERIKNFILVKSTEEINWDFFLNNCFPNLDNKDYTMCLLAGHRLFQTALNLSEIKQNSSKLKKNKIELSNASGEFGKENMPLMKAEPTKSFDNFTVDKKQLLDNKYSYIDDLKHLDSSVRRIMSDITRVFSLVEGGGLTLSHVLLMNNKQDCFKILIGNLAVWGSRLPASIYLTEKAYKQNFYYILARSNLIQLKNILDKKLIKLKAILNEAELQIEKETLQKIITDFNILIIFLKKLVANFHMISPLEEVQDIESNQSDQIIDSSFEEEDLGSLKFNEDTEALEASQINSKGILLPIKSGHMGHLQSTELRIFHFFINKVLQI